MSGTYKLYLARTMLALFSDKAFSYTPREGAEKSDQPGELDLSAHLTNTCLQVNSSCPVPCSFFLSRSFILPPCPQSEALGEDGPPDHLVSLFWDLAGQTALAQDDPVAQGTITSEWLEQTFDQVGKVVAETVTAAVQCGSFGLQLLPNAFEVCAAHRIKV